MRMGVGLGRTGDGPRVGYLSNLSYPIFLINLPTGDKWAYSFDVVHDRPRLIEKRGGNASFVKSLDIHFDGGHNDHSNEVHSSLILMLLLSTDSCPNLKPSHHIPYLYALAGAAYKTQERVREIAQANYNNTPTGLSGVGPLSTFSV
jgi:putative alpha-1,2-mannosidase